MRRAGTAVLVMMSIMIVSVWAGAATAGKKKKARETEAAAAAAEPQPPAGVATPERIEPIAAAADAGEYERAVELLDELLPTVTEPAQKQQLEALRATLFGRATFERWRAVVDGEAIEAAEAGDHERALRLTREAADALDALDLDATGDARSQLVTLRTHVNDRLVEVELAAESDRFNELATNGPPQEALAAHGALVERIDTLLAKTDGIALSDAQRARIEERRRQLVASAGYVWESVFNEAALMVVNGERERGRKVLQWVARECPVEAVAQLARDGLVQMDQ